jgi:hypothetical protein
MPTPTAQPNICQAQIEGIPNSHSAGSVGIAEQIVAEHRAGSGGE